MRWPTQACARGLPISARRSSRASNRRRRRWGPTTRPRPKNGGRSSRPPASSWSRISMGETTMNRLSFIAVALLITALNILGCAQMSGLGPGWVTLIDGEKGLENFYRVGDANWRAEGGAIVADKGKGGHLVTKSSYRDFQLRAEFWADHTTNSGIFIRITDPQKITAVDASEVNIFDQRPGPEYGTGAIVNYAKVVPM